MIRIELEVPEIDYETASRVAAQRRLTVEEILLEFLHESPDAMAEAIDVIGAFSDEPDLIDRICESATAARERDPLRNAQ